MIYFDNAATSWPKPPGVAEAMTHYLAEIGANPGRSGHRLAVEAARMVYGVREAVAELFGAPDPLRVVFGANATEALNLALNGLLRPGDHVVTASMEHNSVMRPLRALERGGVQVTVVRCSPDGVLDPADLEAAIRPDTRLIALNHASNVVGTLLPVAEAGRIARQHGTLLLVDAAQTAGAYPINVQADAIDLLAFTGHKSLYGPMGTGGLVIGERVDVTQLAPLKRGGTGSRSEHEEQPEFLPDLCESGTPNAVGLAGLGAGMRWVLGAGGWTHPGARAGVDRAVAGRAGRHPRRHGLWYGRCATPDGHGLIQHRRPGAFRGRAAPGRRLRDHVPGGAALLAGCAPNAGHFSGWDRALWAGRIQHGRAGGGRTGRSRRAGTGGAMSGATYAVILVYSTSHAMRIEKLLAERGIGCKMIPVPRQISSDCGVCIRILRQHVESARQTVQDARIEIHGISEI